VYSIPILSAKHLLVTCGLEAQYFFFNFYASYFPRDEQNGNRSSKSNDFQYNVLLFCGYLKRGYFFSKEKIHKLLQHGIYIFNNFSYLLFIIKRKAIISFACLFNLLGQSMPITTAQDANSIR
jgi:hypothetical protein